MSAESQKSGRPPLLLSYIQDTNASLEDLLTDSIYLPLAAPTAVRVECRTEEAAVTADYQQAPDLLLLGPSSEEHGSE